MDFTNLSLYQPRMEYRRFGKTEKMLSVITLGGMRFTKASEGARHDIPKETLEQVIDTVQQAFAQGINHIETAWGYNKSETAYGKALNQELGVPRESYFLMTKGSPKTAVDARSLVERQLNDLQTDYLDFYAWHGLNTAEMLENISVSGGALDELHKMKEEGIIKHLGFSTHAQLPVILKTIETNRFEFVNLHYYYTFQRNFPAIELAASKDMGVFIISPNDKGGQLFNPSEKLKKLTMPFSPLQWNARFCLGNPAIHTLTFGLPVTASFSDINGIFPAPAPMAPVDIEILNRLEAEKRKVPYADFDGYLMENDPSGINIPETLRFRTLLKAFDMVDFGKYRYNMLRENDNWYGGAFPTKERLRKVDLSHCPPEIPLLEMIQETHRALYRKQEK
ncbi:MAG: aldo/keto reductase [Bacteroidetes bacterium HGW-Bacteroidetes-4]|nr:MAG: aldo/keto reductase [Bacteroidetes bacterium HGW-Bacteroidetes-4]